MRSCLNFFSKNRRISATVSAAACIWAIYIILTYFDGASVRKNCAQILQPNFLFITVRSTAKHHDSRLASSLETWMPFALSLHTADGQPVVSQIKIVTDEDRDPSGSGSVGNDRSVAFVNAGYCNKDHTDEKPKATCKLQEEYRQYFKPDSTKPDWFCHFDDDVYVNIGNLLKALHELVDPTRLEYYTGRKVGENVTWDLVRDRPARPVYWISGPTICFSQKLMLGMQFFISRDTTEYLKGTGRRAPGEALLSLTVTERMYTPITELQNLYAEHGNVAELSALQVANAVTLPQQADALLDIVMSVRDSSHPTEAPLSMSRFAALDQYLIGKFAKCM